MTGGARIATLLICAMLGACGAAQTTQGPGTCPEPPPPPEPVAPLDVLYQAYVEARLLSRSTASIPCEECEMASAEDAATLRPVLERLAELAAQAVGPEVLLLGMDEGPGMLPETAQGLWQSLGAMSFEPRTEDEEMALADAIETATEYVPELVGVLGEVLQIAIELAGLEGGPSSPQESCLFLRMEAFNTWGDHGEMLDEMLSGAEVDINSMRADGDPELEGEIAAMEQELEQTRQLTEFVWASLVQLGDRSSSVASLEELARQLSARPYPEGEEPIELVEVITRVREACAGPLR